MSVVKYIYRLCILSYRASPVARPDPISLDDIDDPSRVQLQPSH
jgi:hypothetical protein